MSPRGRLSNKQRAQAEAAAAEARRKLERPSRPIASSRTVEVAAEDAGLRLDKLLANRLPELSRARVQQLIDEGHVRIDGRPAKNAERPDPGAQIVVDLPEVGPAKLEAVDLAMPVLLDDEHLIVIDKPAGIAVHPGAGVTHATVVHGLLHQVKDLVGIGGELRPGIVHRLDRETSGCLIVAKTEPALRALQAQFKARTVHKRYRAIVHGAPPDQGELDTPYGRHPVERKRFSSKVAEGRRAIPRWTVLGRCWGSGRISGIAPGPAIAPGRGQGGPHASAGAAAPLAAYVDIELLTGRTHQIRAHFADHGWPLLADKLYGGTKKESRLDDRDELHQAAEAIGRQALHAYTIEFAHPTTGAKVKCVAPLPEPFVRALALLGIVAG